MSNKRIIEFNDEPSRFASDVFATFAHAQVARAANARERRIALLGRAACFLAGSGLLAWHAAAGDPLVEIAGYALWLLGTVFGALPDTGLIARPWRPLSPLAEWRHQ